MPVHESNNKNNKDVTVHSTVSLYEHMTKSNSYKQPRVICKDASRQNTLNKHIHSHTSMRNLLLRLN